MPNIITWRNSAEGVSYPFAEGVLLDSNHRPAFPLGLVVDAQFVVPSYLPGQVTLASTRNSGVRLELNFLVGGSELGTAAVTSGAINNAVAQVIDPGGLSVGTIVFGSRAAEEKQKVPLGLRAYSAIPLIIEESNVFRFPANVLNRIDSPAGAARGKTAIIEGEGIRLVKEGDGRVRIDAVGNPEKIRDCCPVSGLPVRFINDAVPTEKGQITFNVEAFSEPASHLDRRQILRINSRPNTIIFSINS